MEKIQLSGLSMQELKRFQNHVNNEIKKRMTQARRSFIKKIKKMAVDEGLSLDDIISTLPNTTNDPLKTSENKGKISKKLGSKKIATLTKKPAVTKYRHPDDHTLTWTGRGRQPTWVKDLLIQGKTLDDFLIK